MAAVIDNTGQSSGAASVSTITIGSFAVGAGALRFIELAVEQYSNPDRVPTATFNSTENFVFHDELTIGEGAGQRRVTILRLVAPSNVTANIVVSWSGAVNEVVVGATSWTGVDQTTPLGTAVKNSSASATSSSVVVPSVVGGIVIDAVSADAASVAALSANQTQRWRAISGASQTEGAAQSAAGTGSNITCTWSNINQDAPGGVVAHIGIPINAASSAVVNKIMKETFGAILTEDGKYLLTT